MTAPRIFVSYEATDVEIATQLITDLQNANAEVMTDNVDLHDTALEQFLSQELPRCQYLVVLQTPAALQSPRMQLVVESALKQVQAGQMREVLRMIAPTPEATKAQEVPPMWAKIPLFDGSQDYPRGFTRLCLHLGINPDDLYNAPLPTHFTPALSLPYAKGTGTKSPVAGTTHTLRPGTMDRSSQAHTRVPLRLLVIILSIVISLSIIIAGIGVFSYWGLTASKSAQTTTQTVSPTATLPINARTLSPQQLYNAVTSRPLFYHADLSRQDNAQWDQIAFQPEGSCGFVGGAYVMTIPTPYYTVCLEHAFVFSDFAFQVEMTIHTGADADGGGLAFRGTNTGNSYRFRVSLDGSYDLANTDLNGNGLPIALNQKVLLTVIAQKDLIFLYVNKQYIAKVSSTFSNQGQIGFMAIARSQTVDVTYTNAQVWRL